MYMYHWITLLCTWNTVSPLYFNKIYILRKKRNLWILDKTKPSNVTELKGSPWIHFQVWHNVECVSVQLCLTLWTPWTVAHQAPLSMGFSRQEYWSGLPFPSLGKLLDPGIEPGPPTSQADSLPSEPWRKP